MGFPFPFSERGTNGGGDGVGGCWGFEETGIVGRRRNGETVVGTIENANGVDENGV